VVDVRSKVSERTRQTLRGGTIAGVIGGAVLAAFMLLVNAAQGQNVWVGTKVAAYPFLRDRVMAPGFDFGPVLLGLISHFVVSAAWGLLFALVAYGMSRRGTVAFGALWGLVVWIGMFYVVLPLVGAGALVRGAPVGLAIVEHVIFGLAVGIGFLPYQAAAPRRPFWRRAPAGSIP
jgi:hypothetical protein